MATTLSAIVSLTNGLDTDHRIALAFWCMDKTFPVLDAITFRDEEYDFAKLRGRATALWNGPGEAWSRENLEDLIRHCEVFDAACVAIAAIDGTRLGLVFSDPKLVNDDQVYNALIGIVSIVYATAELILGVNADGATQALKAYYDVFYQPTWDHLATGKMAVTPKEMAAMDQCVDSTEPLRTALEQVERYIDHLVTIKTIAFPWEARAAGQP
jgi:hypothetical protein